MAVPEPEKSPKIDEYIAAFPEDVREALETMRRVIREAAPGAVEAISYGIPTFKLKGKNLVRFAGFRDHLSFFPTSSPIPVFEKELAPYSTSRGTVRFPLGEPVPYDLIRRMTDHRLKEVTGKL